jgi:competence protein ComEC
VTAAHRLHPLLGPLLFFTSGIVAAGSFGIYLPISLLPLLLLLTICLRPLPLVSPFILSFLLLFFLCGNLLLTPLMTGSQQERRYLTDTIGKPMLVEGVIIKRPEAKEDGSRLLLHIEQLRLDDAAGKEVPVKGLVQLRIGSGRTAMMTGDRIRFTGKLRPARNYGIAGEFNVERYYSLKHIVAATFVKSDTEIILLGQTDKLRLQRHFDMTAAEIGRFIMGRLPGPEGGVIKALLIGDVADIPQPLKDAYSRTGVNHILSISGFHVGVIALALLQFWYLFSRLFPAMLLYLNFRRVAFAMSLPLILYYLFLSGAAPATVRSVLMIIFVTIGLFLERESSPINLIILAAFALLLANPANLYDISFQLSFVALWGITVLTPLLIQPLTMPMPGWLHKLLLFAAASIAAVLVTLLPVAYYFQQASITGIISNFLIVPLLGYGAVVCGFMAIPFIWLYSPPADWLLRTAGVMTSVANGAIAVLDRIPTLPPFVPTDAEIILFLVTMLIITVIKSYRSKYLLLATTSVGLLVAQQIPADNGRYSLKMDFLSVGQGEATLVTFHDGKTMLIDGGGPLHDSSRDVGRQLLLPALRRFGLHRIDYLVLSHSHPDHLQGLIAVATAMPVGEFWENGRNIGKEYQQLRQLLVSRRIPIKILDAASPPQWLAGVTIRTLHPEPANEISRLFADQNEDSLVLRFDTGRFSALFTGDIGIATEFRLLDRREELRSTLLKVPHHGSRYAALPGFFAAVSPQIAVVSAGYRNSFGLPAPEAIDALRQSGAAIFRTDLDGTVSAIFPMNGTRPEVSAFNRQIH